MIRILEYDLYHEETSDVYGVERYVPHFLRIRKNLKEDADRPENLQCSEWIYNFKKFNRDFLKVKMLIQCIQKMFKCSDVVIVPNSRDCKENNLMRLFGGDKIVRKYTVEKRKYTNREDVNEQAYRKTFVINREKIKGKRLLLVDDISSTGWTMDFFSRELVALGYEVFRFCLGIDYKKIKEPIKEIYIHHEKVETKGSALAEELDLDSLLKDLDLELEKIDFGFEDLII